MSRTVSRLTAAIGMAVVAIRCTGAARDVPDATADASPPRLVDGPALDVAPVACGDARCPEPRPGTGTALSEVACCTASGECGFRSTLLDSDCTTPRVPRGADLRCPGRALAGGVTVDGCCAENGRCGLLDVDGMLGCVGYAADAALCDYRADDDCTSIVELGCDGFEDCTGGQVCCARIRRGRYDRFGCFESCNGIIDGQSGVWVEICHPGDTCQDTGFVCEPSDLSPTYLSRCRGPGTPPPPDAGAADARDASMDGNPEAAFDGSNSVAADASTDGKPSGPPPIVDIANGTFVAHAPPKFPWPSIKDRARFRLGFVPYVPRKFLWPGITCGEVTCDKGEKCCLAGRGVPDNGNAGDAGDAGNAGRRAPGVDSYCEKADGTCACHALISDF